MKRIAIVVGHNDIAQGAQRVTDGRTEFDWNGQLAQMIAEHADADIEVKVFKRTRGGGYSREIDRVYAECDKWDADCTIELHFNGSANPNARGCETLSSGTKGSLELAREVQSRSLVALKQLDRGIKVRKRGDRGGRSLWVGRAPAILTEPYFGSNVKGCIRADQSMDELADAVFRGAVAFLS